MGDGFKFFEILLFAAIAVFIILRLRGVLGRRTGRVGRLRHRAQPGVREQLVGLRDEWLPDGADPEDLFHLLRLQWI